MKNKQVFNLNDYNKKTAIIIQTKRELRTFVSYLIEVNPKVFDPKYDGDYWINKFWEKYGENDKRMALIFSKDKALKANSESYVKTSSLDLSIIYCKHFLFIKMYDKKIIKGE